MDHTTTATAHEIMPNSRKNPTPGWKPATNRPSNKITRATLQARADAATARRLPTLQEEVEASKRKYDWGGPNSYPRRWDVSQSTGWSHPILEPGRRMSRAAATKLGDARGETHDTTDLQIRVQKVLPHVEERMAPDLNYKGHLATCRPRAAGCGPVPTPSHTMDLK